MVLCIDIRRPARGMRASGRCAGSRDPPAPAKIEDLKALEVHEVNEVHRLLLVARRRHCTG